MNDFAQPTEHPVIHGHQGGALPMGSIVLPVDWPDDGRPTIRPISRLGGGWSNGTSQSRSLEPAMRYYVLHVPTPPMPEVGGRLERAHLDQLEVHAIVRDADGWVAQLVEHPSNGQQYWAGPLNDGADWDNDLLWRQSGGVLWLVAQGFQKPADDEPETIGDGPEEWEQ